MLILTRRIGEKIKIADNITIEVIGFSRGKVRLGILAPGVNVCRDEVFDASLQRGQRNGDAVTDDPISGILEGLTL